MQAQRTQFDQDPTNPPSIMQFEDGSDSLGGATKMPTYKRMKKEWPSIHRVEKLSAGKGCPDPRFSFCSVCLNDKYYIWGGRNNRNNFEVVENSMHVYDFRTNTWDSITDDQYKISLTGATPVVWDDKIWVWGGYSTKYHNDMHMFDPETRKWSVVKQNGNRPQRRWHYSAVVHRNKMYMFGGTFDQTHHTDLHIFDFPTKTWSKSEGVNAPSRPRRRHRQVVWREKLYIIGGKEDSDTASTILVYDINKDEWSEIIDADVDTRGCSIPSSHDHSLFLHGDEVYLFGCKPHRVMKYFFNQKMWIPVVPKDYLCSNLWDIPSHHGNPAYFEGSIYFFGGRKTREDHERELSNDMYRFVIEEPNGFSSLAELLTEPREFSNVTFIIQGRKIFADRCILWAKSEYFRNLFSNNFAESLEDNVHLKITNCSFKVFYSLIHYLYTNEMWSPEEWDDVLALLQQADKYQIILLRQHCSQLLCNMVSLENVSTLWKASSLYNLFELKELCLEYIVDRFPKFCESGKYDMLVDNRNNKSATDLIKAIGARLGSNLKKTGNGVYRGRKSGGGVMQITPI